MKTCSVWINCLKYLADAGRNYCNQTFISPIKVECVTRRRTLFELFESKVHLFWDCALCLPVNGHRMPSGGVQSAFTQQAAPPLLSVINSSGQTITQVVRHSLLLTLTFLSLLCYLINVFLSSATCFHLRCMMLTLSTVLKEWPRTAQGQTAVSGIPSTQRKLF